jgi:hypothetical protein
MDILIFRLHTQAGARSIKKPPKEKPLRGVGGIKEKFSFKQTNFKNKNF